MTHTPKAMRDRAAVEREIYGQTTVPEMLDQGAAWGEEVERLRRLVVRAQAAMSDVYSKWHEDARAALSTPPQGPAVGEPEAMK